MMGQDTDIVAGVVGVGSMGQHHARVYGSLPNVELAGVSDVDDEQAAEVAAEHGTRALERSELLETADAVSVAVPTQFHYEIARECLTSGTDVLVEKPFVRTLANGRELVRLAEEHDRILQVGHIERFNPAVRTLADILTDQEIIALKCERLGPPTGRDIDDSAVLDLMIHDIDIVLAIVGESPTSITGAGVRGNQHATATLQFGSDVIAELTASRLTQRKVRKLDIVTEESLINVDYIDRSIEIHRASTPEYVSEDDDVRYRHGSVVERPMVDSEEPLRNELSSFVESVRTRSEPKVTGEDGIEALHIARQTDRVGDTESRYLDLRAPSEVSLD